MSHKQCCTCSLRVTSKALVVRLRCVDVLDHVTSERCVLPVLRTSVAEYNGSLFLLNISDEMKQCSFNRLDKVKVPIHINEMTFEINRFDAQDLEEG